MYLLHYRAIALHFTLAYFYPNDSNNKKKIQIRLFVALKTFYYHRNYHVVFLRLFDKSHCIEADCFCLASEIRNDELQHFPAMKLYLIFIGRKKCGSGEI